MSFSQLAATVLTRVLGDYVDGLDPSNLEVSVLRGEATMRNLKLKRSVLEKLKLPVTVKEGFLGKVSLSIPWTKLESQSTIVHITDIYILSTPSEQQNTHDDEKEYNTKLGRLSVASMMGYDMPEETNEENQDKNAPGYFEGLRMKVIDNLQNFYWGYPLAI